MDDRELQNKPLVEAILEVRWKLVAQSLGHESDPHYKLLLGRMYDRLQSQYPEHEQLPTASMPDELVDHMVQHRFRVGEHRWPLVQLGPGVLTVNSTADYKWSEFGEKTLDAVRMLYAAHPKVGDLAVTDLILRYIDAVEFDYARESVFPFLGEMLKLGASKAGWMPPMELPMIGSSNSSRVN